MLLHGVAVARLRFITVPFIHRRTTISNVARRARFIGCLFLMCRLFVNDPLPLGRKASRDHTKRVFPIFTLLISECTFRTFYYFVSLQSASPAEFFRRVIVVKKEITKSLSCFCILLLNICFLALKTSHRTTRVEYSMCTITMRNALHGNVTLNTFCLSI